MSVKASIVASQVDQTSRRFKWEADAIAYEDAVAIAAKEDVAADEKTEEEDVAAKEDVAAAAEAPKRRPVTSEMREVSDDSDDGEHLHLAPLTVDARSRKLFNFSDDGPAQTPPWRQSSPALPPAPKTRPSSFEPDSDEESSRPWRETVPYDPTRGRKEADWYNQRHPPQQPGNTGKYENEHCFLVLKPGQRRMKRDQSGELVEASSSLGTRALQGSPTCTPVVVVVLRVVWSSRCSSCIAYRSSRIL